MPFRKTRWTSLVELQPLKARSELLRAMRRSKGNVSEVARLLDVSRPTLYSYFRRVGIALPLPVQWGRK